MLTVFDTGRNDAPMFFFVFDRITAKDPAFRKTCLLHVPGEPEIKGKTVTVEKGDGKLVLQTVFGGDEIRAVGGEGMNYVVNGAQLPPCKGGDDGFWGRVEISPAPGNATDDLLNVIFVSDAGSSPDLSALPIETDFVRGAAIGNTAAVFVRNATRRAESFSFTLPGTGERNCYVSGVAAGEWRVLHGGKEIATATEEGGLLVFSAPAGEIALSLR